MSRIKLKKIMWLVVTFSLILSVCAGFIVRASYKNDLEQRMFMNREIDIEVLPDFDGVYKKSVVNNLQELEASSDVILKIKTAPGTVRKFSNDMTITKADVLEVYKGDISETEVYIIEPVYYDAGTDMIWSLDGYYWMNDSDEYIVFLESLKDTYYCEASYIYHFTSARYSRYNTKKPDDLDKIAADDTLYESLREQVISKYDGYTDR